MTEQPIASYGHVPDFLNKKLAKCEIITCEHWHDHGFSRCDVWADIDRCDIRANALEKQPERGPKDTEGKTPLEIFPFAEAEHVVRVFKKGADKYGGPFTYRKGIPIQKLAAAAIRHATAILNGERIDPDDGELHSAHLSANGLMMISQSVSDGK